MNRIKEYCKNNKLFVTVMVIGLLLFFYQVSKVVMYADDYTLAIHSKLGFSGAWEYFKFNYINWGGGWTGFNVVNILIVGIKLWYVIEVTVVFLLINLIIRIGGFKTDKEKALCALISWLFYFLLTINIARETLLWVDGSMAYVFTTFQLVLYAYLLYTRVNYEKSRKKYDYVLLPIAALFAGWSTAQPGAMAVLISIIVLGFTKFINKKEIPKFYYLCAFLCAVGYGIFYFAPGNSARMAYSAEEYASLGILSKWAFKAQPLFESLFDFVKYPFNGIPFYLYLTMILLTMISFYHIKKEENKKIKTLLLCVSLFNILFLLSILYIRLDLPYSYTLNSLFNYVDIYTARSLGVFRMSDLIPYMYAGCAMVCMLAQALYISLKRKDSLVLAFVGAALAAQVVMLMAPTHPNRTLFITVTLFMISISVLIKQLMEHKMDWHYAIIAILVLYNVNLGLFILIMYLVASNILKYFELDKHKLDIAIVLFTLFAVAFGNYLTITTNYAKNQSIDKSNIKAIKDYIANPNEEKIILFDRPNDELYGFTPIVGIEWVEIDIRKYFGLDQDVKFMFKDDYEKLMSGETEEIESEIK